MWEFYCIYFMHIKGNGRESLIGVVLLKDFKVDVEAIGLA